MTQEEKAKAYDEAIKEASIAYKDEDRHLKATLERIFPELAESEDERIRKHIISVLEDAWQTCKTIDYDSSKIQEDVAWLEKQGEKKLDPRYSIFDKLIEADNIYQMSVNDAMIAEARNKAISALSRLEISKLLGLENQGEQKPTWSEDDEIRKALIKGFNECLVSSSHYPKNAIKYWHGIVIEDILSWLEKQGEQNLSVEMKTPEESLGVDSDTYSKIVDECIYGEQKPAWSEEDEEMLVDCFNILHRSDYSTDKVTKTINWLKSLKQRVGG